jgi:hypothetical protein
VVAALFRAGVKKEMIRTDKTSLTHVEAEPNWPADWKAKQGYSLSNPNVSRTDPPLSEEKSPEMEKCIALRTFKFIG